MFNRTERELLVYLKYMRFETELTGGEPTPIVYPDTLQDIASLKPEPFDNEEASASWRKLMSYLEYFDERKWITGARTKDGYDQVLITPVGMDRLDWHLEKDTIPTILRFLKTTLGIFFTSVIVPVVVSILTVFISSKIGLGR